MFYPFIGFYDKLAKTTNQNHWIKIAFIVHSRLRFITNLAVVSELMRQTFFEKLLEIIDKINLSLSYI